MNERRFIELLNLYVDQHITSEEATELEAEVHRNASRRRTYEQYCRLQRGCSLLGEHSRSSAPASGEFARSLRDAERKIASPRRSVSWRPAYGGLALSAIAACVTVIVVLNRNSVTPVAPGAQPMVSSMGRVPSVANAPAVASAPAIEAPAATPVALAVIPPRFEFQPVLASNNALVGVRNAREAEIAANDREALEWMQRVELSSIHVVDDLAFEGRPSLHPNNRVFRSRQSLGGNAEFTAFQFQR